MSRKLLIPGRLPGLNEAFGAARRGKYIEAKLRNQYEALIIYCAKRCFNGWKPNGKVFLHYHFFEQDRRRDKDNIAGYGMKLIQDSLVKAGVLGGDGWNYIEGFDFVWDVDRKNPRIEVIIEECEKVKTNIFDVVEEHENCFVQVLKNSVTGEISVGWREQGKE